MIDEVLRRTQGMRLTLDDRWLIWDNRWVVRVSIRRGSRVIFDGASLKGALAALLGGDGEGK